MSKIYFLHIIFAILFLRFILEELAQLRRTREESSRVCRNTLTRKNYYLPCIQKALKYSENFRVI
jgi:hypothetical protein